MSKYSTHEQQAISLAAIFQACFSVDNLANEGSWDKDTSAALINSTLDLSPADFDDVYPDVTKLEQGITVLQNIFSQQGMPSTNRRVTQYAMTIMYLSRQASKNGELTNKLQHRLAALENQLVHFDDIAGPEICQRLAGIYVDTIGTLPKRIKVPGDPKHLQNELNAARIRALLLTAIRAAFLWRQCGGRQWQLIFSKGRLKNALASIA